MKCQLVQDFSRAMAAMDMKDAIVFFARKQLQLMSPANQDRFEKCIELLETDEMPLESLATVVSGMMRKQSQSANKVPQASQPDVTLRSGGQGSANHMFLSKNSE